MQGKWFPRLLEAMVFTIAIAAVLHEMEKPPEARKGHGKVAGFIPYDFRLPTIERLRESYWNPFDKRILTPEVFGVGWAINFHTLLENIGLVKRTDVSEESFLMPTQSIKETLTHPHAAD